jgi:hypothetical protein
VVSVHVQATGGSAAWGDRWLYADRTSASKQFHPFSIIRYQFCIYIMKQTVPEIDTNFSQMKAKSGGFARRWGFRRFLQKIFKVSYEEIF